MRIFLVLALKRCVWSFGSRIWGLGEGGESLRVMRTYLTNEALKRFKEGKLSLEGLAKKLDVSISEAIDLLAEVGIEAPIEFEDYLKGFEVFRSKK